MSTEGEQKKILILGIGGTGTKVVSRLAESGISQFEYAVVDTDVHELERTPAGVRRIQAGVNWSWRDGSGCGGNVLRGEQALAHERQTLSELMKDRKLVLVTAGLGGGLATGGLRVTASIAHALKINAVFLLTTPFSFEAFSRRKAAEECIAELRPVTDVLLKIPNDLLFSRIPADTPAEQAFDRSCTELARTAVGIASILNAEKNLTADYDLFMDMLRNRRSICGIGVGTASASDGPDPVAEAMNRMLESPFLGGMQAMEQADAAVFSLCAGPGLTLGDLKRTMENASALLPENVSLISGFSTADYMSDSVQVSILLIRYEDAEEKPKPAFPESGMMLQPENLPPELPAAAPAAVPNSAAAAGTPRRKRGRKKTENTDFLQGELALQTFSKGCFANTLPVKFNGVDLDIPAFQRSGISIVDKGSRTR